MAKKSTRRINNSQKSLLFVERDSYQKSFKYYFQKLSNLSFMEDYEDDYAIINFYGIGGKGKTSLVEGIKTQFSNIKEFPTPPIYIYWDANDPYGDYSKVNILVTLRNLLVEKYSFQFNAFDHTLGLYNENFTPKYKLSEYIPRNNKDINDKVNKFIRTTLDAADDLIGGYGKASIDLWGAGKELTTAVYHTMRDKYQPERKNSKPIYLNNITKESIVLALFDDFIDDYNLNIKMFETNVVIFIDTLENIPYQSIKYENVNLNQWLFSSEDDGINGYGLLHCLSHTLWVLTGRNQVQDNYSKEIDNFYSQEITNFQFNETNSFLEKNLDFTSKTIKEAIHEETEGYPLLLSTYYDLAQANPNIFTDDNWFELNQEERNKHHTSKLLERYLQYFTSDNSQSVSHLLEYLICLNTWTINDAKEIALEYNVVPTNEIDSAIQIILSKSIVKHNKAKKELHNGQEIFTFDRTFQEVLFYEGKEYISETVRRNTLAFLWKRKSVFQRYQLQQVITLTLDVTNSLEEAKILYKENLEKLNNEYCTKEFFAEAAIFKVIETHKKYQDLEYCNEKFAAVLQYLIVYKLFHLTFHIDHIALIIDLNPLSCYNLSNYYQVINSFEQSQAVLKKHLIFDPYDYTKSYNVIPELKLSQTLDDEVIITIHDIQDSVNQEQIVINVPASNFLFYSTTLQYLVDAYLLNEQHTEAEYYATYLYKLVRSGLFEESDQFYYSIYYYATDFKGERLNESTDYVEELINSEILEDFVNTPSGLSILSDLAVLLTEYRSYNDYPSRNVELELVKIIRQNVRKLELADAFKIHKFRVLQNYLSLLLHYNSYDQLEEKINILLEEKQSFYSSNHLETKKTNFLRGRYYYRKKQYNEAILEFETLIHTFNKHSNFRNKMFIQSTKYLGLSYIKTNKVEEGITFLEEALTLTSNIFDVHHIQTLLVHVDLLNNLFEVNLAQGNLDKLNEIYVHYQDLLKGYDAFLIEQDNDILYRIFYTGQEILNVINEITGIASPIKSEEIIQMVIDNMNRNIHTEHSRIYNVGIIHRFGFITGYLLAQSEDFKEKYPYNIEWIEFIQLKNKWDIEAHNEYVDFIIEHDDINFYKKLAFVEKTAEEDRLYTEEHVLNLFLSSMKNGVHYYFSEINVSHSLDSIDLQEKVKKLIKLFNKKIIDDVKYKEDLKLNFINIVNSIYPDYLK